MKPLRFYFYSLIPIYSLCFTAQADSQCDSLTVNRLDIGSYQLSVKALKVGDGFYNGELLRVAPTTWKLQSSTKLNQSLPAGCSAQGLLSGNQMVLNSVMTSDSSAQYSATFAIEAKSDATYFYLSNYTLLNNNHAPVASSLSQKIDNSIVNQVVKLIARDDDGDTLSYQLISPTSGTGYTNAYIEPLTAKLYVTIDSKHQGDIAIQYHVSDSKIFSNAATVTFLYRATFSAHGLGLKDVPPEQYATFQFSSPNGNLFGAVNAAATLPASIDLSGNFPVPGDQGQQNSCVAWASAYALKSYQEKLEMNWSLNAPEHLFSPSFIYNQLNGGQDNGLVPTKALDLIVSSGVATLATMPYYDTDYVTQPSAAAKLEASSFKALKWAAVSGTNAMKATLANRQPVLMGITVYPSFYNVTGLNPVYNDYTGTSEGGHAVTAVGYDDNKFGGAFKIINSWGTSWGDSGYFWLPYNTTVLEQAYVLTDAANTNIPVTPVVNPDPLPTGPLPNLMVQDWHLSYDNRPGGDGKLQYKVANTGNAVAKAGANISLVLSKDPQLSKNNTLVVYEKIPFILNPGQYVYRDVNSTINFKFPSDLAAGDYYLGLWVDDQNVIAESNENDNKSLAANKVTFENLLPDLSIETWHGSSIDQAGNYALTYQVRNNGLSNAAAGWYVNLVLSNSASMSTSNVYYLVDDKVNYITQPGYSITRNTTNPAYFNINKDSYGRTIPAGLYYLAMWVDDENVIAESNESNNFSFSSTLVTLGSKAQRSLTSPIDFHNGKVLSAPQQMQKVRISKQANGTNNITVLSKVKTELQQLPKEIQAFDKAVFPATEGYGMANPAGTVQK